MKIVSFNINSIRARPHQIQAIVKKHNPDAIGLQETKVHDDEFAIGGDAGIGMLNLQHEQKAQIRRLVNEEMGPEGPEGYQAVRFDDGIRQNIVINGPEGETHVLGAIVGNTVYPTNSRGEIDTTAEGTSLTRDATNSHNWLNDQFNFENIFAEGSELSPFPTTGIPVSSSIIIEHTFMTSSEAYIGTLARIAIFIASDGRASISILLLLWPTTSFA